MYEHESGTSILAPPPTLLACFPQEDCELPKVEVQEMFAFMHNVRAEVPSDDTLPRRAVLFVEFLLDLGRYVLLHLVFLDRLRRHFNSVVLYFVANIGKLDVWLALTHLRYRVLC